MADETWPTGRYRLLQAAYMPLVPGAAHEPVPADAEVVYDGRPGPHMAPLDDNAHAAVARAGGAAMDPKALDPLRHVPLTKADPMIPEKEQPDPGEKGPDISGIEYPPPPPLPPKKK